MCSIVSQCGHLRNLAKNGKSSLTPRLFVQSKCLHAGYPDIWGSSEILTGSVKPNPWALSTQALARQALGPADYMYRHAETYGAEYFSYHIKKK